MSDIQIIYTSAIETGQHTDKRNHLFNKPSKESPYQTKSNNDNDTNNDKIREISEKPCDNIIDYCL